MARRGEHASLRTLVSTYIGALDAVRTAKDPRPIFATDLSLYLGRVTPWFDDAMSFWAGYVADEIKLGALRPPSRRRVVRYVPLHDVTFSTISQAQEYWLKVKAAMHRLLAPGPFHLVTFGELDPDEVSRLNYCVIPRSVLVESPGIFDGDFETCVERGSGGAVNRSADFVEQFFPDESVEDTDPDTQVVFSALLFPGELSVAQAATTSVPAHSRSLSLEATVGHLRAVWDVDTLQFRRDGGRSRAGVDARWQ